MVRLFICILLLGICAAQYQLWLGRASWSRLSELRVVLNTQREENESLRRTNEALQTEFNSLANNQDAIEERARRELNMVKPNEILFRIETTEEAARKSDAAASMPDVDAPDIAAGAKLTFTPKKSDLYSAPKNQRAPKARDRRQ